MDPTLIGSVVGGLLILVLYSYGIVFVTSVIVQRNLTQERLLLEHYASIVVDDEDVDWEQFDELDDEGNMVVRSFELITNNDLERRRTNKNNDKDNTDENED